MPVPTTNYMISDVLQALLGDVALLLCFLAPGYVIAWGTNVMSFRSRSQPEKFLWAVGISGPLSIVLTCIVARVLPLYGISAIFLLFALAAAVLLVRDLRFAYREETLSFDRDFWIIAAAMLAVFVYCLAALVPIQTAHSLHESIAMADWSIRIPLTETAARGGLPPTNPMFVLDGHSPPMRYYYFWYEICALIMRLTHISARAALTASTAWSACSLMSVLLLTIKYLGNLGTQPEIWPASASEAHTPQTSLRRICVIATGLTCVMSLDLIPAIEGLFAHPTLIYPDIEAWHGDRIPSWPGAVLVAPHHVAGVAFGILGFLFLAILPAGRRQQITHAVIAAICFAALVGTSTYLSICIAIAGLVLVLLRVRHRQWAGLGVIALCSVVAVLIASPFLRELTRNTGYSAAEHPDIGAAHAAVGNHMFKLVLSYWHPSFGTIADFSRDHGLHLNQGHFRYVLPLLLLPYYYLMELSFYSFVIWYQARIDLRRGHGPQPPVAAHTLPPVPQPAHRLMLWALFLGFALTGLFLSSEPIQGINDLERHAGLALRLVLIAWAAPMFANVYRRLRSGIRPTTTGRWVLALSMIMVAIGLGGELWQVTIDRAYYILVSHGVVKSRVWFGRGAPFLQIRRDSDVIDKTLPPDAVVQSNPQGPYQAIFLFYSVRRTAAGDDGCEAAFGGDVDVCAARVSGPLDKLFGGTLDKPVYQPGDIPPPPADPANMTKERFAATCKKLGLSVVIASKDDGAWGIPSSWVYSEPALYSDDATRIIPCPR